MTVKIKKNICPLCKTKQTKAFHVAKHVYGDYTKKKSFFRCNYCDVRYLFPRLNKNQEKYFYKMEFEKFMERRSGKNSGWMKADDHVYKNKETFKRRLKYLKPYLKKKQDILELGCSSGFMLYPLIKSGHKCSGIEPSGVFSKYLKKKGIKAFKSISEFKKQNKRKKFDLIIHFFVLEHIGDPLKCLKNLVGMLKKDGKIIFEIPNVAEPLHTIYNIPKFEKFYWSIAHHWYFSKKSLSFLLNKLNKNFKILLDQRYDISNHLVWNSEGRPGGMGKYSSIIDKKIEKNYKHILIKSGYCDTLIGVINN